MSTTRLLFLYPPFLRAVCQREVRSSHGPLHNPPQPPQKAGFSSAPLRRQEAFAQRYGPAKEPLPPSQGQFPGSEPPAHTAGETSLVSAIEKKVKAPQQEEKGSPPADIPAEEPAETSEKGESKPDGQIRAKEIPKDNEPLGPLEDRGKAIEFAARDPAERVRQLDAGSTVTTPLTSTSKLPSDGTEHKPKNTAINSDPALFSTVMAMPAPSIEKPEQQKIPHLQTPPYVHHFDTYTLVRALEKGGFTAKQSEAIMKGTRSLLGVNMDVAHKSLVSKSDVENETYLFRAACSELRTEILNLRRSTNSKQKSQLSHLQHTFDVLSQRTTAELASLRDELKGMLNDRRMDNRQNSQSLDSEISELNFLVGTRFGGDAKSRVEGLRWVMTRRSAMAFGAMVFMIIGTLWYGSHVVHERERREMGLKPRKEKGGGGAEAVYTQPSREMATQTEGHTGGGGKEGDVGYVSLG